MLNALDLMAIHARYFYPILQVGKRKFRKQVGEVSPIPALQQSSVSLIPSQTPGLLPAPHRQMWRLAGSAAAAVQRALGSSQAVLDAWSAPRRLLLALSLAVIPTLVRGLFWPSLLEDSYPCYLVAPCQLLVGPGVS